MTKRKSALMLSVNKIGDDMKKILLAIVLTLLLTDVCFGQTRCADEYGRYDGLPHWQDVKIKGKTVFVGEPITMVIQDLGKPDKTYETRKGLAYEYSKKRLFVREGVVKAIFAWTEDVKP